MKRLWSRSFSLLFCLLQFAAGSDFGAAEELAAGDKLVPKDTLFFVTMPDIKEFKQKFEHSSFGQLLQDPQFKPFLDDASKKIQEELKEVEDQIGLSVSNLLDLAQGQITLAVLERPAANISVVVVIEYGDHQANVDKLLKELDEGLEKAGYEHSSDDAQKITVHTYERKAEATDNPFKKLTYFTDKSTLVVSTESEAIKEVIERWDGKSDDTLADNEQYKYIQNQCKGESGEPAVKLFANPSGLIKSAIAIAQTSFPQAGMAMPIVSMLGLDSLKGWGGAEDFGEGDIEWTTNFFMYTEDSRGLLGMFNFPASQLTPPKWVPANVASYMTANWNIQGAYKSVETLVDTFNGPGATGRFLDSLAEKGPMIHPKKDVLDHFDGKIHFIQSEPKEADGDEPSPPSYFVGFGLKDAAKMKKTLAAAAKTSGPSLESRDFNGETIYEFEQPGVEQTVSFGVAEGTLVFTNEVQLLEGVIRGQSSRGLALADSPDYKKIAKLFPSKSSMQAFQRSDALIRMYYELAKKVGNDYDLGVDFSKLPPFEVVSKYLTASGSFSVPDKKGMKTVSYSLKKSD